MDILHQINNVKNFINSQPATNEIASMIFLSDGNDFII